MGLKDLLPQLVVNGLLYTAPGWVRFTDLLFGFGILFTGIVFATTEFWYSRYSVRRGLRRAWGAASRGLAGRRG